MASFEAQWDKVTLIMHDINELNLQAVNAVNDAGDIPTLEAIRIEFFGKKGRLTECLKQLVHLSPEEKPVVGQLVNTLKRDINALIDEKMQAFKAVELANQLAATKIDVTLPGRQSATGSIHPITQVKQFINDYFSRLGFDVVAGPEAETEFYNFEALNIPAHHPARAMHDTFYLTTGHLLRTHTSPVQIHAMEARKPPFRLIAPGRVYRCDSDLTHTPMFHQVEGLLVDTQATLVQLKGLLQDFFVRFFGQERALRFRPSYFPFTEPSAEVDIECTQCIGRGCRTCKYTGWLEVGGCGMVHPHVLESVNISPKIYQGFAFGMGVDRLAMLYYGLDDLRMMFENDLTFLQQFPGHQARS